MKVEREQAPGVVILVTVVAVVIVLLTALLAPRIAQWVNDHREGGVHAPVLTPAPPRRS